MALASHRYVLCLLQAKAAATAATEMAASAAGRQRLAWPSPSSPKTWTPTTGRGRLRPRSMTCPAGMSWTIGWGLKRNSCQSSCPRKALVWPCIPDLEGTTRKKARKEGLEGKRWFSLISITLITSQVQPKLKCNPIAQHNPSSFCIALQKVLTKIPFLLLSW